jgi:hypothetical protein
MLEFLRGKASDRKFRLWAIACCRRIWHLLTDDRSRRAIELSEHFADDRVALEEVMACLHEAVEAAQTSRPPPDAAEAACFEMAVADLGLAGAADAAADAAAPAAAATLCQDRPFYDYDPSRLAAERVAEGRLVRDVFGNPFHPVTSADPAWLIPKVIVLARVIYEERTFDRMPELADALEEATCTHAEILSHCRRPGEHVPGCWVLDLLLCRE